jgi:cysteate synthase
MYINKVTEVHHALDNPHDRACRRHTLICSRCGAVHEDNGLILECTKPHEPSLLVSAFAKEKLEVDDTGSGLFRYGCWLPMRRHFPNVGGAITYRSERLGAVIGLSNLWVVFNGFWPEMGAKLETGTFKELEAYAVLSRLPEKSSGILVVASAGNTGSAFANACSKHRIPCLIIVPADSLEAMHFDHALHKCVKLISLAKPADYNDALALAALCSRRPTFVPEGGVKNVARRDGIGTTLLNAVETIGRLPHFYFQAIGSGTGGIAAHETANRIIRDGRFGASFPRLMLSQNLPFAPIYFSWKRRMRELIETSEQVYTAQIRQAVAKVLSNAHPPYSVRGGVFDALHESKGDVLVADNDKTLEAMKIFEDSEGIDIEPAAGVAAATLIETARNGGIPKNSVVLLHITGGGMLRRERAQRAFPARPILEIAKGEYTLPVTVDAIENLF